MYLPPLKCKLYDDNFCCFVCLFCLMYPQHLEWYQAHSWCSRDTYKRPVHRVSRVANHKWLQVTWWRQRIRIGDYGAPLAKGLWALLHHPPPVDNFLIGLLNFQLEHYVCTKTSLIRVFEAYYFTTFQSGWIWMKEKLGTSTNKTRHVLLLLTTTAKSFLESTYHSHHCQKISIFFFCIFSFLSNCKSNACSA